MENASEALIMAFAVLVLVLALSVSISSFTQAKRTADSVMQLTDSRYDYTYIQQSDTKRTVSSETIIPTLYRAYKENIVIIFRDDINTDRFMGYEGIFAQKLEEDKGDKSAGQFQENLKIDLQSLNIGSEENAIKFINCLLYGKGNGEGNDTANQKNLLLNSFNANGSQLYSNSLQTDCLYDIINNSKFKEYIGVYYMDDEKSSDDSQETAEDGRQAVSDANKTKRRVITYVLNK